LQRYADFTVAARADWSSLQSQIDSQLPALKILQQKRQGIMISNNVKCEFRLDDESECVPLQRYTHR
jgi:hypothetical protein